MARLTLPSGRMVEYTRDNVRRVRGISTAVNGQKQAIVSEISYRADGGRTGYLYGNGLSGQRVYDRQGRLLRQELGVRSAGTWSSKSWERHYQYDKNSNLVRRGPSPDESEQNYGYDALDRLEEERKAGPPEERQIYEYDLNGNRLREREKQEIEHFLEKGSNRLLATEELLRTGEGKVEESSTSWRYEYNNAGRLKTVYQEGVKVSTYLYGADGLRRKKTVYETDGSTVAKEIHYHYVSGLLVSETTATGTLLRDYLWNPDRSPLAQIEGSPPGNSQEQLLYLHTDHLLTPRRATNTAGTSVWSWESSAFGKESPKQDPDGDGTLTVVQLRYPGQYHDAETGLYYNWHRYYNPSTGRYIQSEPIGLAGGLNTYSYALQNTLMYIDPNGLEVQNPRDYPISPDVWEALEKFNEYIGCELDIVVTGGDRPKDSPIGAGSGSQHAQGTAADIKVPDVPHLEIAKAAIESGLFSGIGWYEEGYLGPSGEGPHVHVDLRTKKTPTNPDLWGKTSSGRPNSIKDILGERGYKGYERYCKTCQ